MKLENLEFVKASPDGRGDDPTKGLLAANMPLLLNTAWSLSAMDIEASVSSAKRTPFLPSLSLVLALSLTISSCFRQAAPRNTSRATLACRGRHGSTVRGHCFCSERFAFAPHVWLLSIPQQLTRRALCRFSWRWAPLTPTPCRMQTRGWTQIPP